MNKLNLDISKYSCDESFDIFNIEKNLDANQVTYQLNKYKNNILTDNNLNLGEKDNIANFLHNVIQKLTQTLDKKDTVETQNTLIQCSSINHPIIQNPYMNPIT